MRKGIEKRKICPFCGNEYIYETEIFEDGYDWEGHHRGNSYTDVIKQYCPCGIEEELANILKKIKPMCINCEHCDASPSADNDYYCDSNNYYCKSPRNLAKMNAISDKFDLGSNTLKLKDAKSNCEFYKFDINKLQFIHSTTVQGDKDE